MSGVDPNDFIDDVAVIVLAGGAGERLGSKRPKAFTGVAGEAMLVHSLRSFEEHPAVDSITLVVPEDWVGPAEVMVDDLGCDKVAAIEVGGPSRAASVVAGLAGVPARRATAVLVHDAARPIVPSQVIDRVVAAFADGADSVVPTIPVVDTIKIVSADGSVSTPARDQLRAAQTPQGTRADVLHSALSSKSPDQLAAITDCSSAVESGGGNVVCVDGDAKMVKITVAQDVAAVEGLLGYAPDQNPAADEAAAESAGDEDDSDLTEDDIAGADTFV